MFSVLLLTLLVLLFKKNLMLLDFLKMHVSYALLDKIVRKIIIILT